MKKILITAKHSYIGNSFAKWVEGKYDIDFISCRDDKWKKSDFSQYDVVFHVAGIAHVDAKEDMKDLYYKVNRDLTIEIAKKARLEGVNQFVFMSSIIVYGESNAQNRNLIINRDTKPNPNGFYGDSKLQAEEGILKLQDDYFNIVIIRCPMTYGKGSKGNFSKLEKIAKITPIFPNIDNKRSMLYIDNLCEFLRLIIDNEERGVFYPQNNQYVNTTEIVKLIGKQYGKRIQVTTIFNPLINVIGKRLNAVNKAFGTLVYEKELSIYKENYNIKHLQESLKFLKE